MRKHWLAHALLGCRPFYDYHLEDERYCVVCFRHYKRTRGVFRRYWRAV